MKYLRTITEINLTVNDALAYLENCSGRGAIFPLTRFDHFASLQPGSDDLSRGDLLKAAGIAVLDRSRVYGPPFEHFERIARLWNAHLKNRGLLAQTYGVNEVDVAQMLGFVKDARLAGDQSHTDSWVDKAGYAACGGEVAERILPPAEQAPCPYEATGSVNSYPPFSDLGADKRSNMISFTLKQKRADV